MKISLLLLSAAILVSVHSLKLTTETANHEYPLGYNSNPNPNNYNNYNGGNSQTTPRVNGVPYYYTGPFELQCIGRNGYILKKQSCYDQYSCKNLIDDFANCGIRYPGAIVKKFNNRY